MKKSDIQALAREVSKTIMTEKDLKEVSRMFKQLTVEAALNAELDEHLGYVGQGMTG